MRSTAVPGPPLASTLTSHGLGTDYYSLQNNGAPPPSEGVSAPAAGPTAAGAGSLPELKLGPAPVNQALDREVKRKLKDAGEVDEDLENGEKKQAQAAGGEDAAGADGAGATEDGVAIDPSLDPALAGASEGGNAAAGATTSAASSGSKPSADAASAPETDTSDLVAPVPSDLPPYPSTFRTLDVQREVELVREARKRIRLGGEAYAPEGALIPTSTGPGAKAGAGAMSSAMLGGAAGESGKDAANGTSDREDRRRGIGKPSVCLFTLHDTGDRSVLCRSQSGLCWRTASADLDALQPVHRVVLGGFDRHGNGLHRVVHSIMEPERQGLAGPAHESDTGRGEQDDRR